MVTDGWQLPYSLNLQFCFWQTHWFYDPQYIADKVYLPWYIFKIGFRKHTMCWNTLSWKAPVFPRGMQRSADSDAVVGKVGDMENYSSSQRDKHGARVCGSRLREEAATGNPEEVPCVVQHTLCLIELLLGIINTAGNMLMSSYWGQKKKIKRSYFDFLSSLNEINGFKSFSKPWAVEVLFPYLNSISRDFVSSDVVLKCGTNWFQCIFFSFSFSAGLQWEGRIVSGV